MGFIVKRGIGRDIGAAAGRRSADRIGNGIALDELDFIAHRYRVVLLEMGSIRFGRSVIPRHGVAVAHVSRLAFLRMLQLLGVVIDRRLVCPCRPFCRCSRRSRKPGARLLTCARAANA